MVKVCQRTRTTIDRLSYRRTVRKDLWSTLPEAFETGYRFLESTKDDTAPWGFSDKLLLADFQEFRKKIKTENLTLHSLDKTTPDFPKLAIALKTAHFPIDLITFLKQVNIQFDFKSIHLDYLKNVEITTVDDVINLSKSIWSKT